MIYATVNLTIGTYKSTCDSEIVLYRGDKNVEIRFVMKGNKFTVLDSTYAQMIIKRPSATPIFSKPALIQNNTVVLTITEDMIDEMGELGTYTFQIRLYDTDMNASVTLPPCESALIVERPIAIDGESAVNLAVVNASEVISANAISEDEIFNEDNSYNKTIWADGDLITDARLNKIEDALFYINEKGGGGSATAPYISTSLDENVLVGVGQNFNLHLDFSSPNLGKGTLKVFINDVDSMSTKIDQGETVTVIPGELFIKGTNQVVVYVLDRVGMMSNSLTFYARYGSTEISSTFDPYISYDYGSTIRYYFTPIALDTSKTLTFNMTIDGQLQGTVACISDTRSYFTFPTTLEVGNHYCEAWVTDGTTDSNKLCFDLIIIDNTSLVVASDTRNPIIEEGEQLVLDYKVYMKNNSSFIVKTYVDNVMVNTGVCGLDFNYYRTSSLVQGTHTVKVEVYDVTETYSDYIVWTITVTESTYEMLNPVSAGSSFIASAKNRTNTDANRDKLIGVNQDGQKIEALLSNFTFNNENGWVDDTLIISGNSWVDIPIQPLADNAKYGFTLDVEFSTKPIGVENAEVLTLWNEEKNCGIKITTEELILRSAEGNQCDLYFTEDEFVSAIFVIDRNEKMAKIYLNGVMCEAFALSDYEVEGVRYLEDFTVNSNLYLGGYNKNGYSEIKNIRVYEVALATDEIINNFISNKQVKSEQRALVEFQKGDTLPTLTVYCDFSGLGKDDKKPCNIVYNSPDENLYGKSFTLGNKTSQLQYQGTSSMAYPIKNYRLNLRDENGEKWKYNPFSSGQPEARFTLKADFMSSGHWQNTGLAKWVNDNLYHYKTNDEKSMNPSKWYDVQNEIPMSAHREAINGFPCRLILVNDGETPLNEGQYEPTPGNTKDMGVFNFNNDKDNVATLGFDSDIWPNCASFEVTANSDTSAGAFMSYKPTIKACVDPETTVRTWLNYIAMEGVTTIKLQDPYILTSTSYLRFSFYRNLEEDPWDGKTGSLNAEADISGYSQYPYFNCWITNYDRDSILINNIEYKIEYVDTMEELKNPINLGNPEGELAYLKESFELRHPDSDDVAEDWGFMGVEGEVNYIDVWDYSGGKYTTKMNVSYFKTNELTIETETGCRIYYNYYSNVGGYIEGHGPIDSGTTISIPTGIPRIAFINESNEIHEKVKINDVVYYYGETISGNGEIGDPYTSIKKVEGTGLKALIDWVDNCTDEEFVADFEEHFHKDYTLRYYLLVITLGMVDNLGKNMMLDTWDCKIWMPRFYDMDTICSYDNSGQIKFDVDIEMEQGYWNTSASRLWTRIRDLMHDDLVEIYKDMRANGMSYESFMNYFYGQQISQIPQKYYNMDADVKYLPFADEYIGKAHGDGYEHLKRWLKKRLIFTDTLFDYAPSYNNDILTIRANTTEEMTIEIETYTPVYQHVSWYNGQMDKKKIDGKVSVTFSGKAQAATDQEVLIYGGTNIKRIKGLSSMNPNQMLIGGATRLIELEATNCPLLVDINSNKANLSPHTYLNKVDLSGCSQLGGTLRLNNSPLIQEINMSGTAITNMILPSSIRNLESMKLPNGISSLTLNDAGMLNTLEFDEGVKMQSVAMSNCNALTNVVNFDLLNTPTVSLNNSYTTAAELYFRDTTNLTLRNMPNLERVIYTPNVEHETFELINVANAPDYKVTTFNCPKLSIFMTTAPYRESYNNCGMKDKELILTEELLDGTYEMGGFWNDTGGYMNQTSYRMYEANIPSDADELIINIELNGAGSATILHYFEDDTFISRLTKTEASWNETVTKPSNCNKVIISVYNASFKSVSLTYNKVETIQVKDYGDIQPNTTFTANSIDISSTQFTDVKLLCTTDTNTLKLPTTVKNFYCDSSFDLDTDYLEDGEYDVVHGELVEPYTTDYEGEILLTMKEKMTFSGLELLIYTNTAINTSGITYVTNNSIAGDYIEIVPGTVVNTNNSFQCICFFDENKLMIGSGSMWVSSLTAPINAKYTRFSFNISNTVPSDIEITCTPIMKKTPNLIPSSADGSLIFSMYAPSNAVAPASGTWDLKGLEFDNFHTFGMNNDVKPSEDSYIKVADVSNIIAFTGKANNNNGIMGELYYGNSQRNNISISCLLLNAGTHYIKYSTGENCTITSADSIGSVVSIHYNAQNGVTFNNDKYISLQMPNTMEYIEVDGVRLYHKDMIIIDSSTITLNSNSFFNIFDNGGKEVIFNNLTCNNILDEVKSISMPARYDDYNITIKNANISPKTHNTMLYPLLVNEDNPITGTLDYTNYVGKHLSWSFAYTDEEYVNIIQPKDELLNSYEYEYNAFYDTEYEFDNPYEIAKYTSSASGVLPTFNTGFTYTYDEKDNGDGTYTTNIYADSLDNLPTSISFDQQYVNDLRLLTVDKLSITSAITTMQNMFRNNRALTYVNTDGWDTSNVTNMDNMFYYCMKLTSLDTSNFDTGKVIATSGMFQNCSSLTSLDVSNFDTGVVAYMNSMFQGCGSLTSLDTSNFDTSKVTNMSNMFYGCSKLASLDISNFDTGLVTIMSGMFQGCSGLTSLDVSNFDTTNVTNMSYMFIGCGALSLDVKDWNVEKVTNMYGIFSYMPNITSIDINGWATTSLVDASEMFSGSEKLTTVDTTGLTFANNSKIDRMFYNCYGLTEVIGIETWDVSKVVYMSGVFRMNNNGGKLTSLNLASWDVANVTNMGNMFGGCSSLIELDSMQNISTSLDLSSTILDATSLLDVINNLLTVTTTQTLTLGSTLLAKLTEDQIAIATNKGWTVS